MSIPPPRPRSVTMACAAMGFGSVLLVLVLFQNLSDFGSLEQRERFGESVTFNDSLKAGMIALLVLAIAGAVFALFAARGDRASRNSLTVAWLFIGLGLTFAGGFSPVGLALAVVLIYLLWRPDARQWFAAVNSTSTAAPTVRADPFSAESLVKRQAAAPAPEYPGPPPPPASGNTKPRSIILATTITLIGSGVVAAGSLFMLAGLALVHGEFDQVVAESAQLREGVADLGLTTDQVFQITLALMIGCLVLALAGIAAALLVLSRKRAGLISLAVVASLTLGASILGFPVGIPWTVAAIVVLVQLRHPDSKTWFRTT